MGIAFDGKFTQCRAYTIAWFMTLFHSAALLCPFHSSLVSNFIMRLPTYPQNIPQFAVAFGNILWKPQYIEAKQDSSNLPEVVKS